jgi:pyruvate/2-oxoglutarate dehydrogenase complex dihydrolipoamide dehydrogenase (E3) component
MTTESFDVVILCNAGIGVTGPVRRAGMSVALIEPCDLGGTCPNRGCTPNAAAPLKRYWWRPVRPCMKSSGRRSITSR